MTWFRIQEPSEEPEQKFDGDVERNTAATKISKLKSPFGYSPTLLLPILTAPTWLSFLNLPLYLYGPLAMGFLAYIKSDKDKQDNSSARGVIGDPNVIFLLMSLILLCSLDSTARRRRITFLD